MDPPVTHVAPTWRRVASPVGDLLLVSDGRSLSGLYLEGDRGVPELPVPELPVPELSGPEPPARAHPGEGMLEEAARQLAAYFAGELRTFSLPIAPSGTPFQLRVWQALCEIPYGTTRTYGEIAAKIGHAKAARAVGAANGQNPISIVVPCHRLIGADGSLTGYGGGLAVKAALLELEAGACDP